MPHPTHPPQAWLPLTPPSVDALLTSAPNPPTFRAAIMESGTHTYRARPADPGASWDILVGAMGCNATTTDPTAILACMRALPATTIRDYNEQNRIAWPPSFDNVTSAYTAQTNRRTRNSHFAAVPILGGSNANEGRLYSISATDPDSFVEGLLPAYNQTQRDALLALYPLGTGEFANDLERLAQIYTDFIFQCTARRVHRETSEVGVPSWRYFYNASFENSQIFEDADVYHASEIGVVLGTYQREGATEFQARLSRGLQRLWADFARDPWGFKPRSDEGGEVWMSGLADMGVLAGGVRAEDGPDAEGSVLEVVGEDVIAEVDKRCDIWEPIYDVLGK